MNTEKLVKLAKAHEAAEAEIARLQQMQVEMKAEESKLLKNGNLESEDTFRSLSTVRLKLDMIPPRINVLEESIAGIHDQVEELTEVMEDEHEAEWNAARKGLKEPLIAALSQIFPPQMSANIVHQNFWATRAGAALNGCKLMPRVSSRCKIQYAKALLKAAARLAELREKGVAIK